MCLLNTNSFCLSGIWTRDIRYKTNLTLTSLNKILKSLEGKKIIKAVKSVSVSITIIIVCNIMVVLAVGNFACTM